MTSVLVEIRVDLAGTELDEAALAAQLAEPPSARAPADAPATRSARASDDAPALGDALRSARALDGALVVGDAAIYDELFSAVQRLCFEAAVALLADEAVVDYRYFSSNSSARLAASGDRVVLSGTDLDEADFPRLPLIRSLHACGERWLAVLVQLGRTAEADHLQPFAAAARTALAGM
jgi:hypothetical protein